LQEVQTHPIKLSMGLAMMEIVFDTVKEEEENAPLYQFIKNSILFLDQSPRKQVNIFIYFILHLTRYLGFLPNDESEAAQKVDFDIRRGTIRASQHNDATAHLLRRFLHTDLENCQEITFDQTNKRFLIKTIFDYYQEHIQGFRYPQTLKVFSEVFE
ncbi:MAG: DNA repair protein RecO C-terminal domain-containing protein, partial [Bacteroidota bacterium]